jgi:hypothetical protein
MAAHVSSADMASPRFRPRLRRICLPTRQPGYAQSGDRAIAAVPRKSTKSPWTPPAGSKFFTEPHYNGFPAVLVRLPAIGVEELEGLIVEAWRCQAPALVAELERRRGGGPSSHPHRLHQLSTVIEYRRPPAIETGHST